MRKGALLGVLLFTVGAVGATASGAAEIRPLFKAGYDFGGDTLVTVVFTDGSTHSIKSNDGLYLGGGISILNEARNIETEVSLSFKFDTISADNGDVDWTRFPLDVLVFYRMPKLRVGGGATYHINPKLDGSGAASNVDLKFDNALGLILQADYFVMETKTLTMSLGVRYTALEYKVKGGSASADSNGLGVTFGIRF